MFNTPFFLLTLSFNRTINKKSYFHNIVARKIAFKNKKISKSDLLSLHIFLLPKSNLLNIILPSTATVFKQNFRFESN